MKSFKVHKHPALGYKAIKIGFSWPAFFFSYFWLLVSKLWRYSILIIGSFICLVIIETVIEQSPESGLQAIAYLVIALGYFFVWMVAAFKGNEWLEKDFIDKGFILISSVDAKTKEAAIAFVAENSKIDSE